MLFFGLYIKYVDVYIGGEDLCMSFKELVLWVRYRIEYSGLESGFFSVRENKKEKGKRNSRGGNADIYIPQGTPMTAMLARRSMTPAESSSISRAVEDGSACHTMV